MSSASFVLSEQLKFAHFDGSASYLSTHSRPSINPNSMAFSWRMKAFFVRIVVRISEEIPDRTLQRE